MRRTRQTRSATCVAALTLVGLVLFYSALQAVHDRAKRVELDEVYDFEQRCTDVAVANSSDVTHRCCPQDADDLLVCFAHVYVMGPRKSLSTGLYSWLLLHPQVFPSNRKEKYTFDDPVTFETSSLRRGNFASARSLMLSPAQSQAVVNVDATPVYIENLLSCQRIAAFASPSARFVVVLRHPIKRLLSAFLMDRRRAYLKRMRLLLKDQGKVDFNAFIQCVKGGACLHPSQSSLARLLGQFVRAYIAHSPGFWTSPDRECLENRTSLERCVRPNGPFAEFVSWSLYYDGTLQNATAERKFRSWLLATQDNRILAARRACDQCASSQLPLEPQPMSGDVDACLGCRCQCRLAMARSPIRGLLYRPMLDHCFEHLNRSRFLLLDYDVAAVNMSDTARRVVAHAGLSPFDFSRVTSSLALQKLNSTSQGFVSVTGWAHDSAPASLDNVVRPSEHVLQALRTFYASDTDYLRRLTGLPLQGW